MNYVESLDAELAAAGIPARRRARIVAEFADETIQDHAYAAIHGFLPAEEESHT